MKEINFEQLISDDNYFFEVARPFVEKHELENIAKKLKISFYTLNSYFVSGNNSRSIDWRLKRDIYILMLETSAQEAGMDVDFSTLYLAEDISKVDQSDLLNEIKGLSITMTWDELSEALKIKKRALKNYRMPESSSNYRLINNRILRDLIFLKDKLAQSETKEMPTFIEDALMASEAAAHIDVIKNELAIIAKSSK